MDINITEARLLTKEEAGALPERLRLYGDWWWTSSSSDSIPDSAWFVRGDLGRLDGGNVDRGGAVRPALIFESEYLKTWNKFSFGEKEFEVIKDGLAFCTTDIGECAFREDGNVKDANQYEASDIKKYIDNWFAENLKTNNIKTERKTNMENYIVINGKKAELTKEQLEKLGIEVKHDNPFVAAPGESYYFIASDGGIIDQDSYNLLDKQRYCVGNYCRDKDLMQQRAYHEMLDRLLWRFACENGELDNPWDEKHTHYSLYNENEVLKVDFHRYVRFLHPTFPSKEIAQRAIDEIVKPFMKEHPDFVW